MEFQENAFAQAYYTDFLATYKICKYTSKIANLSLAHQSVIIVDLHRLGTVGLRRDGAQLWVQHVDGAVKELVVRRVCKGGRGEKL